MGAVRWLMAARILVVDDDPSVLQLMRVVLKRAGWSVRTATTPEEAMHLFRTEPCELLVTDKNMPGITGFELIASMREIYPDLPAIVVTAFADPASAPSVKIQGYLSKPFESVNLIADQVQKVLSVTERRIELGLAKPPPPHDAAA